MNVRRLNPCYNGMLLVHSLKRLDRYTMCLNPCYNGMLLVRCHIAERDADVLVLILVIMECCWFFVLGSCSGEEVSCLNPCYNGMLLVHPNDAADEEYLLSLNPCYNGMLLVRAEISSPQDYP